MNGRRPTEARIDLAALRANYAEVRRRAGGAEVIAVLKADGYGHGAVGVAAALARAGCRRFAVATVEEAACLRAAGQGEEILVLGGVHDAAEADQTAALGLTASVHHRGHLELLAAAAKAERPLPVHLEIDTGMSRMGVPPGEARALLQALAAEGRLRLAGTYTHLARADEGDLGPTRAQLLRFADALAAVRAAGLDPGCVHFANSAGWAAGQELAGVPPASAVRVGLALYGVSPSPARATALRPVMTLATRVAHVREIAAGDAVGYGAEFVASRKTRIATLPAGYADGIPRAAGGRAWVRVRGSRLPLVGRVSMDFVTVDAGLLPVSIGDEAIFFGDGLPVDELAAAAGTIAYEILVRIGSRVPRVLVGE